MGTGRDAERGAARGAGRESAGEQGPDELEWRIQEREQDSQLLARLRALSEGTLDRELLARLADFLEAADASEP